MKREVERKKAIPAFSIELAELEVLWNHLSALFNTNKKIYTSISLNFPSENIEFENLEELQQYPYLKGKLTRFSFYFAQDNSRVRISADSGFVYSLATVHATSDNEAWCAGAVDTVYSFFNLHRIWYHWIVSPFMTSLISLTIFIAYMSKIWTHTKDMSFIDAVLTPWVFFIFLGIFLHYFRKKLFPPAILVISYQDYFIRKHSGELSLVFTFIAAVIAFFDYIKT